MASSTFISIEPSPAPHAAMSSHNIWRHKDSSEKTPTSLASDDAAYIYPAEPVSPSSSYGPADKAGLDNDKEAKEKKTAIQAAEVFSQQPHVVHVEDDQQPQPSIQADLLDIFDNSPWRSHTPESTVSLPAVLLLDDTEDENNDDDSQNILHTSPPILAPLEPLHMPPPRRATPPGLPSYEAVQRAREARMYRNRGCAGEDNHTATTISTASGALASLSSRVSRWRHSPRYRSGSRRRPGNNGICTGHGRFHTSHTATTGPVWRPPVSQHSLANHPYLREMPIVAAPPAPAPSPALRRQGSEIRRSQLNVSQIHTGTTAAAVAETEARAGRTARPVTLDDYRFLRSLRGSEVAGEHHHGVQHDHENTDDNDTPLVAMMCLRWCVYPCCSTGPTGGTGPSVSGTTA